MTSNSTRNATESNLFSKSQDEQWKKSTRESIVFQQGTGERRVDSIRGKIMNYFNFAIANGNTEYKNLGDCANVCS